ncbi:MAG: hypothetical protein ACTS6J_21260 [Burkholderiales bacterium]
MSHGHAAPEPRIDARAMLLHRQKHHASQVAKLNAALDSGGRLKRRPRQIRRWRTA